MHVTLGELMLGMSMDFVKEFMDIAMKESHAANESIFKEGDEANHFYVLLEGSVNLKLDNTGKVVYAVQHQGEVFGWSSLTQRTVYSATAICEDHTSVLKIDGDKLKRLLEKKADNGVLFYKHLAATLGNRLLQVYQMIPE